MTNKYFIKKRIKTPLLCASVALLLSIFAPLAFCPSVSFAQSGSAPLIFLPEKEFLFGAVPEGVSISHNVIIENRGTAPLEIYKITGG